MGEIEEEEEYFCPRLRWAQENAESLGWLQDLWKRYKIQKEILKYMAVKPRYRSEILSEFHLTESRWRSFMNEFGHRDVEIKTSNRWKDICYQLVSPPRDYKFHQRLNYYQS